jgi:hypothetical protein
MTDRTATQRKETRYVALCSVTPSRLSCLTETEVGI